MIVSKFWQSVCDFFNTPIWAPEPRDYSLPDGTLYYPDGALKGFAIPATMPVDALRAALKGFRLVPSPDTRDVAWILEASHEMLERDEMPAGPSRASFEDFDGSWTDPRLGWRESAELNQAPERRGL